MAYPVGTVIEKDFGGDLGTFEGVVSEVWLTEAQESMFHVVFHDGDEEDIELEAMQACDVVSSPVDRDTPKKTHTKKKKPIKTLQQMRSKKRKKC